MKAAHEGVPVAALPGGVWQSGPQNPFAPLLAPFAGGGGQPPQPPASIPQSRGRGGAAPVAAGPPLAPTPAAQPAGRPIVVPSASDAPVPPAEVPSGEPSRKTNAFLDRIFGRL